MTFVTLMLAGMVIYSAPNVEKWVATLTAPKAVTSASCSQSASNQALTPSEVTVNVYNATARSRLAVSAAGALEKQGFKIAMVDNDPLGRAVAGIGEIRYGTSGLEGATLAQKRLPGAAMVLDYRIDATVDFVVGQKFKAVKVPPKIVFVKAAKATPHC
jgi:hypothetical protein